MVVQFVYMDGKSQLISSPHFSKLFFPLFLSFFLPWLVSTSQHRQSWYDKTWQDTLIEKPSEKKTWAFLFQLLMWILIILILILILIVLIVAIAVPMSRRPKRVSPLGGVNTLHVNFFLFFFSLLKQAQSHERQEPARFDYNSSIASKQTGVPLPYSSSSSSSFFPSVALASLFL